jgi:hypothetical protein
MLSGMAAASAAGHGGRGRADVYGPHRSALHFCSPNAPRTSPSSSPGLADGLEHPSSCRKTSLALPESPGSSAEAL